MRIVLVCNAGMSTSILVQKMEKSAQDKGIQADISAFSVEVLSDILEKETIDCVLVGPQIRHMLPEIEKAVQGKCPVAMIDMRDYGTMNGAGVLDKALELVEN